MSKTDLLRAELRAAELEEALVAAKADGAATNELKLELRAARQAFRELRAAAPPEEGVARPDVIRAKARG